LIVSPTPHRYVSTPHKQRLSKSVERKQSVGVITMLAVDAKEGLDAFAVVRVIVPEGNASTTLSTRIA